MTQQSLAQISVSFNGTSFLLNVADGAMMPLNEIYEAAGNPANKEPWRWLDTEGSRQFIDSICEILNLAKSQVLKTKRGRHGGGTWAHWKVAVRYAAYLAPALDNAILDVFRERIQEEINPDLAIKRGRNRAMASWRRQGRTEDWIEQRCKQIDNWHGFTDTLKDHGVEGYGYVQCANSLNVPILKGTSKEVKALRNIPPNGNLRDALDEEEIAAINFAQVKARKKIKTGNIQGNQPCAMACFDAAQQVASIL